LEIAVTDNGSGSANEIVVNVQQETSVGQANEANVENQIDSETNTGGNTINQTTSDLATIDTGSISENVTVENSLNQSNTNLGCCAQDTNVSVVNNGAGSENSVGVNIESSTSINIQNTAKVTNLIDGNANTGFNKILNTNGDSTIKTGNILVSGGIQNLPINVVDISGGSGGGDVNIFISSNAAGSTNQVLMSSLYSSEIAMSSLYDNINRVDWDLNTGENEIKYSNGESKILTGDIIFDFFVKNGPINVSNLDWDCCNESINDPGEDPVDDPSDSGVGGDNDIFSSGSGSSSSTGASGSSSGGIASILGLSDTSSPEAQSLLFVVGLLFIASGLTIFGKEALQL
jgi:hypothetical protein